MPKGCSLKLSKFMMRAKNEAVWHILRIIIHVEDLVVGDIEAQIESARIGAARFLELVDHHELEQTMAAFYALVDYSERLMRGAICDLPDGDYCDTTYLDGFLNDPEPARSKLPLVVTLKVCGDGLTVDLTEPRRNCPINRSICRCLAQ
jgi:N-methylhydantoinase B